MSATLVPRGRRLLSAALARAESFLLEPAEAAVRPAAVRLRPVVTVVGLARGCGSSTVARALAVELASGDPAGAAAVAGDCSAVSLPFARASATRLARAIGAPAGRRARPVGWLCLLEGGGVAKVAGAVRHLAPLVFDVRHGEPAGAAASLADHVLLVASPEVEPALATVAAASLARVGPAPSVLLNGVGVDEQELDPWSGRADAITLRSRAGAQLALAGRRPPGALGAAIAEVATRCEAVPSEW